MMQFIPELGLAVPIVHEAEHRAMATPARKTRGRPPAPAVASAKVSLAKRQGAAMGAAFAPRNWADHDRIHSFASAIRSGIQKAQDRSDYERWAAGDNDFLRSIGF